MSDQRARQERSWEGELAWGQSEGGRRRTSVLNMKVPRAQHDGVGHRLGNEYGLGIRPQAVLQRGWAEILEKETLSDG